MDYSIELKKFISEKFLNFILSHPEKDWDWREISRNPSITLNEILSHPELKWKWYCISTNPNITMEFILSHPEKNWNWYRISSNSSITLNDILSHPEKEWNWNWISKNPNITLDDILSHPEKEWNWGCISTNPFTLQRKLWEEEFSRKWFATFKIKKWWIRKVWNPSSRIGRKRLERSYYSSNYEVW